AFIHPSSVHGVLVELKQVVQAQLTLRPTDAMPAAPVSGSAQLPLRPNTIQLGDIEIALLSDGLFGLDGGAMFGGIPRTFWAQKAPPDEKNRIRMAMRPVRLRGARTRLIDADPGHPPTP